MIILGIESTCDETAASLVEDGRHLLSNVISTSVKEQALYGGVVPEIASRRHCEFISATVKKALLDAGKTIDDVIKLAMVRVWRRLRDEKMESRLILTVHDELIVEAPEAEAAKAAAILQEEMEGCVNYAVPLSTEVHQGKNWLEAH